MCGSKNGIRLLKFGYILHVKSPVAARLYLGLNYFILAEAINF